jgi:hypothetical protein
MKELSPGTEPRPEREQNLRHPLPKKSFTNPVQKLGADAHAPTVFPQDSFTSYIIAGPLMLGRSLLKSDWSALNGSLLLGSFVNISVAGYIINIMAGKRNKMDPFGPMVAGAGQIIAGLVFPASLPTAKTQ